MAASSHSLYWPHSPHPLHSPHSSHPLHSLVPLLLLAATLAGGCADSSRRARQQPVADSSYGTLVWSDEFDYEGLPDPARWSFDTAGNAWGWGNNELQCYTAGELRNAEVKDGILTITAQREDRDGFRYTSARLVTRGHGDWLYGRVEVRARLPAGRGVWPAIWMLPSGETSGGWPSGGEIDIMENVGYDPATIHGTIHTEAYNHLKGTQRGASTEVPGCSEGFHLYAVEWEPDEIRFYADGKHFFTFPNEGATYREWPFDKPFHLILNVAVGGSWGGQHGVDDSVFPAVMAVDWVRIWQKGEQP